MPSDRFAPALTTLGGVQDHNMMHFTFIDAPAMALVDLVHDDEAAGGGGGGMGGGGAGGVDDDASRSAPKTVTMVTGPVLLLYRFKPDNIMHAVHDDVMPAFQTATEWLGRGVDGSPARPYRIVAVDGWPARSNTQDSRRMLEAS